MKNDSKQDPKLDFNSLAAKASGAATDFVRGFAALVKRNPKTAAVVVAVLLFAVCINLVADAGMRDMTKQKQAAQEKQFQAALKESQLKRVEDAQRQKIEVDAQRKAELQSEFKRFASALAYDFSNLNATGAEYGGDALNEYNFARKLAAIKKMILIINEYKTHLDGFEQFIHENFAELKRLGVIKQDATEESLKQENEKTKAKLKEILTGGKEELEKFVGVSPTRRAAASEVLQLASDSIASFEAGEANPAAATAANTG